ncbi:hypothetical protein F5X97DRAFT_302241 [Nemania serpens]|nr:hypothetical protein F5X97DRAFT_302241 [Nemania serpens]
MYCPSSGKKHHIEEWIQSIEQTSAATQPRAKCIRTSAAAVDHDDDHDDDEGDKLFAHPFDSVLLHTPPLTLSHNPSCARKPGRDDLTDNAAILKPSLKVPIRRLKSPNKRSRSDNPAKGSRGGLEMLEKPVFVRQLETPAADSLPANLRSLYSALEKAVDKVEIIPYEVRDQICALLGDGAIRSFYCRQEPTPGAEVSFTALCEIHAEARAAAEDGYHESAWNHTIHTPLLKQVFTSRKPGRQFSQRLPEEPEPPQQPGSDAIARVVATMSVAIWDEYLPNKRSMLVTPMPNTVADEDDSVSGSVVASYTSAATDRASDATGTTGTISNCSDSKKKVDYVLVMDARHDLPLRKVFAFFVLNEAIERDLLPHVNQTMYRPLQWSPIACSIETKFAFTAADPLSQLGTWVAAWHKRMSILRNYIFESVLDLPTPASNEARIPSALLIQVVSHEWHLYFACDHGTCIEIYGPMGIGSTASLLGTYVLTACLRAIRRWIEKEFREDVEKWLMCEEVLQLL